MRLSRWSLAYHHNHPPPHQVKPISIRHFRGWVWFVWCFLLCASCASIPRIKHKTSLVPSQGEYFPYESSSWSLYENTYLRKKYHSRIIISGMNYAISSSLYLLLVILDNIVSSDRVSVSSEVSQYRTRLQT